MELDIVERAAVSGGYTPAERFRARLADGRWVFVKRGVGPMTSAWLETEARAYRDLKLPCMATMLQAGEFEGRMTLVLEDLAAAHWPPPWRPGDVQRVLDTMQEVFHAGVPAWVPQLDRTALQGWIDVQADPRPFLGLGLCSPEWLRACLPGLVRAEAEWPDGPEGLCHFDLRSDNLCLASKRVVLVDWNHVCRGPAGLDVAFWSASLAAEGGPLPESVAGERPMWAARVSGFFAARAGLPELADAPRVRWVQKQQLATALPWVVRALGLPEPGESR